MNPLRLSSGINLHSFPKDDIVEYVCQGVDFLKKHGFDAADFPMNSMVKLMGDRLEEGVAISRDYARSAGVAFEVCHLPFGVKVGGTEEEVRPFNEAMHKAIDAAKLLGVEYAVLHPNTTTVPMECFDRQAQYDSVMAHLTPFAEHAAKIGLNIVVENMRVVPNGTPVHRYCQNPDELCDIADALGIGICWDFGHANINAKDSGIPQSEALAYVGSRLKVLHVNDNVAEDDLHLPPFIGNTDWKDAMKGLASTGFNGLFNYELGTARIASSLRDDFARYIVDAAKEIMSYL